MDSNTPHHVSAGEYQPMFDLLFAWEAFVKKAGTDDLTKALLEEVVRSYFLASDTTIPGIRNSEDWFIFF